MAENSNDTAKRQMLTMRVTQALKDRIAATADANGRSVSQEIETRLERSLYEDDALGDPEQAGFIRWLAAIMDAASRQGQVRWTDDPEVFGLVRSAATLLFDAYQPEDIDAPSLDQMSPAGRETLARWEEEVDRIHASAALNVRRYTELHLKKDAAGLSDDEQSEMEAAHVASQIKPVSLPALNKADRTIHGAWGRRRQLMKRSSNAVVQLIAAINAARGSKLWD